MSVFGSQWCKGGSGGSGSLGEACVAEGGVARAGAAHIAGLAVGRRDGDVLLLALPRLEADGHLLDGARLQPAPRHRG